MTREEVFLQVEKIFKEVFDDNELVITDSTNAEDIEDWDSFEQINLLVSMETEFHIKFNIDEVTNLKDVGEIIDLILKKVG